MTESGLHHRGSPEPIGWPQAFAELVADDSGAPLGAEDLERLAVAAYMIGRDEECAEAWLRAHRAWLLRDEPVRAARCALWRATGLLFRGEVPQAMGWVARGRRLLDDAQLDCAERGWLLVLTAAPVMFQGDAASARPLLAEAVEVIERFGDPDLVVFARVCQGEALVRLDETEQGMELLDEVMVSVLADDLSPIMVGLAYCTAIGVCQTVFDLGRAREWTAALSRWCDSQPGLIPYRGNCLVHRCEILQLQGAWREALVAARQACEWLAGPPAWDTLGAAHYQLGEIQRLRGDFRQAEASYRRASQAGRDPEPGMSLLRLAQGRLDQARAAVERVMAESGDPLVRARLLPAQVEILLASGEIEAARQAAEELGRVAEQLDVPYMRAVAEQTTGAVLLAAGDPRAALPRLRTAHAAWRGLDAPYESGLVRALLGLACREVGDETTAELELDAACGIFAELGAQPDLDRVTRIRGRTPDSRPGGLTAREQEVLALVAAGRSNRAIAAELVISEKTVGRHLSNIFVKLGVSSRSQAAAYAYEHGLV